MISRTFTITDRYEQAPLHVTGDSVVKAELNGTTVTMTSYGKEGTGKITVTTDQTANYKAGTKTFTAKIVDHGWHCGPRTTGLKKCHSWHGWQEDQWPSSRQPDCTNNGIGTDYCSYENCTATKTHDVKPRDHFHDVWGGTASSHRKCSKCEQTVENGSYHSYSTVDSKSATCCSGGYVIQRCACGHYKSWTTGPLGHSGGCRQCSYYGNCGYGTGTIVIKELTGLTADGVFTFREVTKSDCHHVHHSHNRSAQVNGTCDGKEYHCLHSCGFSIDTRRGHNTYTVTDTVTLGGGYKQTRTRYVCSQCRKTISETRGAPYK